MQEREFNNFVEAVALMRQLQIRCSRAHGTRQARHLSEAEAAVDAMLASLPPVPYEGDIHFR